MAKGNGSVRAQDKSSSFNRDEATRWYVSQIQNETNPERVRQFRDMARDMFANQQVDFDSATQVISAAEQRLRELNS